ncbi:hypothetical protein AAGF08_14755 [Algoriphagus sp. SE2]|uniref:hypothetical protein n=1 Tax=Algoriphagus sp. SE2 TaxID=3141536 RepID=UPI0031CD5C03
MKHFLKSSYLIILVSSLISCTTTASIFDQMSYKETISAKIEALALMDKATENYQSQKEAIDAVTLEMAKVYEYEKNRPNNTETIKMWELLMNPEKNLFGGFMKRWESESTLSKVFVDEAKPQIEKAFDIILGLENKKVKPEEANSFLNNN